MKLWKKGMWYRNHGLCDWNRNWEVKVCKNKAKRSDSVTNAVHVEHGCMEKRQLAGRCENCCRHHHRPRVHKAVYKAAMSLCHDSSKTWLPLHFHLYVWHKLLSAGNSNQTLQQRYLKSLVIRVRWEGLGARQPITTTL